MFNQRKKDKQTAIPDNSLLSHLLDTYCDPKEYIEYLELLEEDEHYKECFEAFSDEIDEEEAELLDIDIETWNETLIEMRDGWHPGRIPDMDKEHEIIREWLKKGENLLDG